MHSCWTAFCFLDCGQLDSSFSFLWLCVIMVYVESYVSRIALCRKKQLRCIAHLSCGGINSLVVACYFEFKSCGGSKLDEQPFVF